MYVQGVVAKLLRRKMNFPTGYIAGGVFVNLAAREFMQSIIDFQNELQGNSILGIQDVFKVRHGAVLNLLKLP